MNVGARTLATSGRRPILESTMSSRIVARMSRGADVPPVWTSVLAVIAHPDHASFGLGAILDAFFYGGTRVGVLCLTHSQAWTLDEARSERRTRQVAVVAAAPVWLGPVRVTEQDRRYVFLGQMRLTQLAEGPI